MNIQSSIENLKRQKIGVLGIGVEGVATIAYLLSHGITNIEALDKNEVPSVKDSVKCVFGDSYLDHLERFSVIFKSPGFRPDLPALVAAQKAGTQITSAVSFFLAHCPAPVIGITGTVGKGTASSILAAALTASGFSVHLGGNIGKSPLTFLDEVKSSDRVVLELSSFQTMDISGSPKYAGILKTTTEHLDWHINTEEYRMAKANLLRFQTAEDVVVYNADAPGAMEIAQKSVAVQFAYSLCHEVSQGIFLRDDRLILRQGADTPLPIDISRVGLAGKFNLENIAAAVLLAVLAGGDIPSVCTAAQGFKGLANRLELAASTTSIRFFNDSYATRPDAAAAAISAFDEPLALIMGGSEKNADFAELFELLLSRRKVVSLSLIGATAQRMQKELSAIGHPTFPIEICDSLATAMQYGLRHLPSKGVLLMAPACASFGMFKNYKDRGEQFVNLAKSFAAEIEERSA